MGFVLFVSVIAFYVECWLFLLLPADVYDNIVYVYDQYYVTLISNRQVKTRFFVFGDGIFLFVSVVAFYVECWLFLLFLADFFDKYFF